MYKRRLFRHLLIGVLGVFLLSTEEVRAQDIHYSQFFHSTQNVNPALTGIFNGDIRIAANFKNQWQSIPVPYTTFTGAYDQKFYSPDNDDGFWSGGVLFNYDRAGDSKLSLAQLGVSGSYSFLLNDKNILTLGLQVGVSNRSFDLNDDLRWDAQWNGVKYEPGLPHNESFDQESIFYFDASTGLNYRWQKDDRTHIDLGSGVYHLTQPNHTFYEEGDQNLSIRLSPYLMSSFQLTNGLDLLVNVLAQFQGPAQEIVPNATLRIHINRERGKELALDIGGIGRFSSEETDAYTPMLGIGYRNWYAAFSYDINSSELEVATDKYGGPEVSIIYRISKVKPLQAFKTCPIF